MNLPEKILRRPDVLPKGIKSRYFHSYDIHLLLLILFAFNYPFWNSALWPKFDTVSTFEIFHAFYNHFFFHGELALWLPYGTFGIPSNHWQLFCLSPFSYLFGCLGKLFHIQNVLLLFKMSILAEECALLFGTYLLSRLWFKRRSVIFLVCFGVIASTVWLLQIYWNFRIYYLIPLALYFLALFLEKKRGHYFWLCGVIFIFSLFGNIAYFAGLYLLILILFCIPFIMKGRFPWPNLFERTLKNGLSFLTMVAAALLYLYFAFHLYDHTISYQIGRDPLTQITSVESFLSHGWAIGFDNMARLFFPNLMLDHTLYIGLLPLLFMFYGILKVRRVQFISICLTIIFLFLISMGKETFVAEFIYNSFLPMRWFRYIGQIGSLLRIFLLFGAGFGFEELLHDLENKKDEMSGILHPQTKIFFCGAILLGFMVLAKIKTAGSFFFSMPWYGCYLFAGLLFIIFITSVLVLNQNSGKSIQIMSMSFLVLDLLCFQYATLKSWPNNWPAMSPKAAMINQLEYQEARANSIIPKSRAESVNLVAEAAGADSQAVETYNFMQFDPCVLRYIPWSRSKNIDHLMRSRGGLSRHTFKNIGIAEDYNWTSHFLQITGCSVPKLRLILDQELIRNPEGIEEVNSAALSKNAGNIKVISFGLNHLNLQVDVKNSGGTWLYYADAYHPGWRASANGISLPISQVNLAFKAVKLSEGKHDVQFSFFDGLRSIASYSIAFSGCLFAVIVLQIAFFECRRKINWDSNN